MQSAMTSRRTQQRLTAARILALWAMLALWAVGCTEASPDVAHQDAVTDVLDASIDRVGAGDGQGLVALDIEPFASEVYRRDVGRPLCRPGELARCACFDGRAGMQACDLAGRFQECSCPSSHTPDRTTPRLVSPRTHLRVSSRRPTVTWLPPADAARSRVELCADRPCTRSLGGAVVSGTSWRPAEPLEPGMVFWRVTALDAAGAALWRSPTWLMYVRRRDAGADTALERPVDFNGDGYDDLLVRSGVPGAQTAVVYWGSPTGLHVSRRDDVSQIASDELRQTFRVVERALDGQLVGDMNGDGYTDLLGFVWTTNYVGTILLGEAEHPFARHASFRTSSEEFQIPEYEDGAFEDMNGDGFLDRVTFQGRMLRGSEDGLATAYDRLLAEGSNPRDDFYGAARFQGDYDGDGRADLWGGFPVVWYGGDALHFTRTPPAPFRAEDPMLPTLGDFNGDRYTDVVDMGRGVMRGAYGNGVVSYGTPIGVVDGSPLALFDGAGYYAGIEVISARPEVASRSGDLNGDGVSDAIVTFAPAQPSVNYRFSACANRGWLYRFDGHPAGLNALPTRLLTGTCESLLIRVNDVADYNGDGLDDVLIDLYDRMRRRYAVIEGDAGASWGLVPYAVIDNDGNTIVRR